MRKAFTLIELMIAISILSIIMIFLYKSYSELNNSNRVYEEESKKLQLSAEIKKVLFLDIALAMHKSLHIANRDKQVDNLFMHSTHSLHRRINPYVAYIVNNKKLYRVESLRALKEYPFSSDIEYDVDYIGNVESFRVYGSQIQEAYLLDILFKNKEHILQKVKVLNEY